MGDMSICVSSLMSLFQIIIIMLKWNYYYLIVIVGVGIALVSRINMIAQGSATKTDTRLTEVSPFGILGSKI